jgi:ABC-type Fe3+/spermidine/putrescine transport system ATPase subunit
MRIEVKLLQARLNIAVLFVTHDQVEALSLSDNIALMNYGVIQQQGAPRHLYEQPANPFVRDFVGKTLLLHGTVTDRGADGGLTIRLAGRGECVVYGRSFGDEEIRAGASTTIGVRPEDIEILPPASSQPPQGMLVGHVRAALFVGERVEYQVEIPDQGTMVLYGDRHDRIGDGSAVWLRVRPDGHSAWETAEVGQVLPDDDPPTAIG